MEKRKLLIVAISVGVFLVLAIGAAILIFTPRNAAAFPLASSKGGPATSVAAPSTPPPAAPLVPESDTSQPAATQSMDALDLVRSAAGVPGLKTPPEGVTQQEPGFYVNGAQASGTAKSSETTITVPKPSTAAVPNTAPAGKAASPSSPRPPSKPAQTAPSVASQPKPSTQTKTINDYWIQVGAYSTSARAQGVKDTLSSKGITSVIVSQVVNNKTVFRVRVGPYTSQNEANYWNALLKSIDGFEDSQIRLTQRR